MRETNRKATKILAITKKVIETPSVAGRRVSMMTAPRTAGADSFPHSQSP
ncbi:hypothetical protein PENSUB_11006 [Penicillium subrubescens]|uniref:Uncharacterized protein n=1 Tax=Penicillium subrubescens TaxID=1316194 RepID=A0A1Q5T756_9EURO|nr:hypothetical protein PENSUB_11006 [Penicillium subrubescens]